MLLSSMEDVLLHVQHAAGAATRQQFKVSSRRVTPLGLACRHMHCSP